MIGSSMPASVMIPKNRIANTNMPTTGATFLIPVMMKALVCRPNPPSSAAMIGKAISATRGERRLLMTAASKQRMVMTPRVASMGYSRAALVAGYCFPWSIGNALVFVNWNIHQLVFGKTK